MERGHEIESPTSADETPLPMQVDGLVVPTAPLAAPTAASVLLWITAADGAWFPARFAAERGVPRDSLDEPLAELRLAGLVLAAEWVRGVGQGYAPTPAGKAVVADPAALEQLKQGALAVVPIVPAADLATPTGEHVPVVEVGAGERESELALRPPVVVPALLIANAVWFFVCVVWGIRWGLTFEASLWRGHAEVLHRFGAVTGMDLVQGEWWRLFTCCFVHIGALHLLGNLFALAMMGPLAELLWGRGRLLLIYVLSGLAGSALAMALRPDSLLAGASGAIWGIQMSLFAWLFAFRRHLPPDLAADWFRRLSVVFLVNAGVSFLPNVSWEGHLGGGIAGLVAAGLLNAARFGDRPRRIAACTLLTLLPVLCVAGLAGAMGAKGMPGWQKLRQRLEADRAYHENLAKVHRVRAAAIEYEYEVVPRLLRLSAPEGGPPRNAFIDVTPGELTALLALRDATRSPARLARARANVAALKKVADEAAERTAGAPTGAEALDLRRARAHQFAQARAESFGLLLAMLASDDPPAPEAWDAWQAARRDADRLRDEMKVK